MIQRTKRRLPSPEVAEQLRKAGVFNYLNEPAYGEQWINAFVKLDLLPRLLTQLRADQRFAEGLFFGLHRDVGNALTDFRSFRGEFGWGSLQLVIDKETGRFYADVDKFSPYADVVGFLGHTFTDVLPGYFKKVFS